MLKRWKTVHTIMLGSLGLATAPLIMPSAGHSQGRPGPGAYVDSDNGAGISRTLTLHASFNQNNPFFKPLGTNGRTCATCHPVNQGMVITPDYATQVFTTTNGLDPLFATVDGANSPTADMSTVAARRANCSMLLTRGLIRVGLPIPANAEFTLEAVDDPYHYASAAEISCFRRPLPATNLSFLSTVMWDGRERPNGKTTVAEALASQIKDAVRTHMQGVTPPTDAQVAAIVDFETALYTSQVYDDNVGDLDTPQIGAGPEMLIDLPFYPGINDAFGLNPNGLPFNQQAFTFYRRWLDNGQRPKGPGAPPPPTAAQLSVARGEQLFNTRTFVISGVAGLNDILRKPSITGTCSTCHSTVRVGSNSLPFLLNTGIADGKLRTPDLPLYTLRNKQTGQTVQTTDPGAALTTGRWADIGKFKVPSLRGLETLSPYMHNGFSGDLLDILDFYDNRFNIGLTDQEKADLKAFLTTL
jgi:cytochrome c peroxidase